MRPRVVCLLLIFFLHLVAFPAEARLGCTKAEWEAKFGKPDANGIYLWEGPGGRARPGPYEMMIRIEDGEVTGIQIRKQSKHIILNSTVREIFAVLQPSEGPPISMRGILDEKKQVMTLLMPEKEPPVVVGETPAAKGKALMGKYTHDFTKEFGKADEKGFFTTGPYRLQTATNRNSGKVDWIKVVKASGEPFTEEEAARVYASLTGRKREEVTNPPSLHEENTILLMMKPKRNQ